VTAGRPVTKTSRHGRQRLAIDSVHGIDVLVLQRHPSRGEAVAPVRLEVLLEIRVPPDRLKVHDG
jgi:hypothetical protein